MIRTILGKLHVALVIGILLALARAAGGSVRDSAAVAWSLLVLGGGLAAAAWLSPGALRWVAVRLLARAAAREASMKAYRIVYRKVLMAEGGRVGG
jgi:hypothetical protein